MKQIFSILFLLVISGKLSAQDCKVMIDSLKGYYDGDCKSGMANGQGTAKGVDIYIGKFKNGYPDGKGKYTWKNGNWYDGNWKKGLYQGEGILHLIRHDSIDSRDFAGFWKEGKYLGLQAKPYIVYSMTNMISDVSIRKNISSPLSEILITVYDKLNGASTLNSPNKFFIPKQKLTDIQLGSGSFTNRVDDEKSSPYNNMYELMGVVFPIRLILYFENEMLDVEILEKGNWNIKVDLEKIRQNL